MVVQTLALRRPGQSGGPDAPKGMSLIQRARLDAQAKRAAAEAPAPEVPAAVESLFDDEPEKPQTEEVCRLRTVGAVAWQWAGVQGGGDFGRGEFRGENFAVKKSGEIFPWQTPPPPPLYGQGRRGVNTGRGRAMDRRGP